MTNVYRVLCVDQEKQDSQVVEKTLGPSYRVIHCNTGEVALKSLDAGNIDIVLLEVVLPDTDGFRLCATLQNRKETQEIPVILLTTKGSIADKIIGFSVGADDYIVKPFDPTEFKARVESRIQKYRNRLTRLGPNTQQEQIYGDIRFQPSLQRAFVKSGSSEVLLHLTPIEFKILFFLASHQGSAHSREALLHAVWGEGVDVFDRTVDTHVSAIRRKIPAECQSRIETVHGSGYAFFESRTSLKKAA